MQQIILNVINRAIVARQPIDTEAQALTFDPRTCFESDIDYPFAEYVCAIPSRQREHMSGLGELSENDKFIAPLGPLFYFTKFREAIDATQRRIHGRAVLKFC
jgi:hypothetical protein